VYVGKNSSDVGDKAASLGSSQAIQSSKVPKLYVGSVLMGGLNGDSCCLIWF